MVPKVTRLEVGNGHAATLTRTREPERLANPDDPRTGGGAVAGLEIKNVGEPDETRPFAGKGQAAVVNIAGHPVL
jgi:hypothetical protein